MSGRFSCSCGQTFPIYDDIIWHQDHRCPNRHDDASHVQETWGVEQSCGMLWVGPMRPDGEKVDQAIVSLACGQDLTDAARIRQHQYANAIAALPELLDAVELAIVTFRFSESDDFARHCVNQMRAALVKSKGEA